MAEQAHNNIHGTTQIKGLKELYEALQTLPVKLERNVMRSALRAGMKVIMEEAKSNVPARTGALRDSFKISTRLRKGTVTAKVSVGNEKAFYGRFVEFGTAAHVIAAKNKGQLMFFAGGFYRSVSHPGAKARPFMRPALDNKADDALRAFAAKVRSVLSSKHGIDVPAPLLEGDE
jgi:HK97 gp10 family phage protein